MVMAKAGTGVLLEKREPAPRDRASAWESPNRRGVKVAVPKRSPAHPPVLVVEKAPSARKAARSANWRGRPTAAELEMRTERARRRIRDRHGVKPRVRLTPERKAIRAERRAKRKGAAGGGGN